MKEFEVSRRPVARDLDFLRDEERAPLAYDDARLTRKEAFSFGLAHDEGTPLHLDTRSVPDNPLFALQIALSATQ